MQLKVSFYEDIPLMELIYLVFTRTPGGVIVGDSGLCCCVPCLSSALISLCVLFSARCSNIEIKKNGCTPSSIH